MYPYLKSYLTELTLITFVTGLIFYHLSKVRFHQLVKDGVQVQAATFGE